MDNEINIVANGTPGTVELQAQEVSNDINLEIAMEPVNKVDIKDANELDYNSFINKPKINNVVVQGNKSGADYLLASFAQGQKADTALQPGDNVSQLTNDANYQTGEDVASDIATHNTSAAAHSSLFAGKQDTISDLNDIRAGASAGATALQPGANISELVNNSGYQTAADVSSSINTHNTSASAHSSLFNGKQETLVSGTNIKTINNISLLGSGDITIGLPSQTGQSGKFLTTDGTNASWGNVPGATVDQTFDGTSSNAQSGVAINGKLADYIDKTTADQQITAQKIVRNNWVTNALYILSNISGWSWFRAISWTGSRIRVGDSSNVGLQLETSESTIKAKIGANTYDVLTTADSLGVGKNIGEVYFSESSSAQDNPGGLPLFTGETISNADQVYPDFYDWVLAHTDLQISAANYESAITTYGECPKYVIDDTNKTIRLPKLVNYLKMANITDGITQAADSMPLVDHIHVFGDNDGNNAGNFVASKQRVTAPNPDITEGSGYRNWNGYGGGGSYGGNTDTSTGNMITSIGIKAAAKNATEQGTLQPAHTTLFPWVCAYNAAVPASTAQAAAFQAALTGKADTTLANVTAAAGTNLNSVGIRTVVETYRNGASWYRVWSDGWCEQGGRFYNNANTANTINFLKEFADTNFSVFINHGVNGVYGGGLSGVNADEPYGFTTTGFRANTYPAAGVNTIQWEAKGYIN